MTISDRIDLPLLQARWVLGGIGADQLVGQAVLALEQGFDGSALRQLAGFVGTGEVELGSLPEKVFREMGLGACSKEGALDVLVAHGSELTTGVMLQIVEEFPDFSDRWRAHLADWGGKAAGPYNDIAEVVHFAVEELYEKDREDEVSRLFRLLEQFMTSGNQETRDLVGIGFFETLQNFTSWRPYGNRVFERFLGPVSKKCWREIQKQWAGKSSLMDVIRSERGQ